MFLTKAKRLFESLSLDKFFLTVFKDSNTMRFFWIFAMIARISSAEIILNLVQLFANNVFFISKNLGS